MTNLIPMAGEGQRFKTEGYLDPKPTLKISNQPMFLQAIRCLPRADRWVFVCQADHARRYPLSEWIREAVPNAAIVLLEAPTEGQACTSLAGMAQVDPDDSLLIGACDNGMQWDPRRYRELTEDPKTEAILWTFRNHPCALRHPAMYSWVEVEGSTAKRVSLKQPIHPDPTWDHGVVGTFWFRKASLFAEAARRVVADDRRTHKEFYVDTCLDQMIRSGLCVRVFEVTRYISWGTPEDVKTYQYWQSYFDQAPDHPYRRDLDPDFKETANGYAPSVHRPPLL